MEKRNKKIIRVKWGSIAVILILASFSWILISRNNSLDVEEVVMSTDFAMYSNMDDMTKASDLIIKGKVLNSEVREIDDLIKSNTNDEQLNPDNDSEETSINVYTVYTIKVSKCLKGDAKLGSTIEVKVLGGELNGKTVINEDDIKFTNNENYIFFLETYENNPAELLNPIQASFDDDGNGNFSELNEQNNLKLSNEFLDKIEKENE